MWCVWQMAHTDYKLLRTMRRNFIATRESLRSGRIWTPLTAAFSHINFLHLAGNMFSLYMFGATLAPFLGTRRFAALYFTAAASGSLSHMVLTRATGGPHIGVLGARGPGC